MEEGGPRTVPVLGLTYRDAARSLGVCERSVWQMVKDGKLKGIRIGRSVRIPLAELERFVADACGVS